LYWIHQLSIINYLIFFFTFYLIWCVPQAAVPALPIYCYHLHQLTFLSRFRVVAIGYSLLALTQYKYIAQKSKSFSSERAPSTNIGWSPMNEVGKALWKQNRVKPLWTKKMISPLQVFFTCKKALIVKRKLYYWKFRRNNPLVEI